ncbi:diguanylate cyclase domain-containing protein [Alkalisalibacterium limincola]|uniref:histidine kinase n=1 Tax=Alkalisalibacterium limincola TaxID=2699169 RepID=A0A5C8L0E5_9GAMM|nr:diguanylate cyclase [Alkalisalibacterium limincola]TXK65715.1 diguanylate cyclase [Alkalisalibacterium limincola]
MIDRPEGGKRPAASDDNAKSRLPGNLDDLVAANERLLCSAVEAEQRADACSRALKDLVRSAKTDPLTGLPNRLLLMDRFDQAISRAKRDQTRMALLFLDLDNFKEINDSLGHQAGDDVLRWVAERIINNVREVDTVSRHGGDEFIVLLDGIKDEEDAVHVAEKLISDLMVPCELEAGSIELSASIGISLYPDHGEDASTLIGRADAAMYLAKRHRLGGFVMHGEDADTARGWPGGTPEGMRRPGRRPRHMRMELQEANGQLVLATMGAQQLEKAAEEDQRRQAEFLGTLAHELRSPLTPIRIAASMLGNASDDCERLSELQAVIEGQVSHMSRLVGDLLDVARVSTGKVHLAMEKLDLVSLLREALRASDLCSRARHQILEIDLPAEPVWVTGDPLRLTQVFNNLLDNAVKYTPAGGRITLTMAPEDDMVKVVVSDNGIGITAEALDHIFEPFHQDTHATDFDQVGLGIGLTVARELVQAHGGGIEAKSPGAGLGATFTLTLPLAGSGAPRHEQAENGESNV